MKTVLPSYIPLRPHLPQNHYNIEKTGLLNGNDLWKNSRKNNGRSTRIYHQSCSDVGNLGQIDVFIACVNGRRVRIN